MKKEKSTERDVEEQETKKTEKTNTSDGFVIQLN